MFTWLATKAFLKKAWTWLKHNWYVPLIIVYTLFLWVLFRRKDEALKVLEIRSESYKAQIETINKIHAEEIKKRDEILKKYAETVKKLEDEYIKNNS